MTAQPSPRQVLLDLADRCEREEPSWGLCGEIEAALFPGVTWWRGPGPWLLEKDGRRFNPPGYAFSLDAAVTLVPEGCSWDVRFRSHHDCAVDVGEDWATRHPTQHSAHVWRMAHRGLYDIRENGTAKTPTLALCAAALRARAEAL